MSGETLAPPRAYYRNGERAPRPGAGFHVVTGGPTLSRCRLCLPIVIGALFLDGAPSQAMQVASGGVAIGGDVPPHTRGIPTIDAIRVSIAPEVDGRLDDEAWRRAVRITRFVQRSPIEGAPATEDTEVYLAYDSDNLYFAVYAHYSDNTLIRANRSDRDQLERDDTFNVYIDPFMDQQRAYLLSVNGYGVQGDAIVGSRGGGGGRGGGCHG